MQGLQGSGVCLNASPSLGNLVPGLYMGGTGGEHLPHVSDERGCRGRQNISPFSGCAWQCSERGCGGLLAACGLGRCPFAGCKERCPQLLPVPVSPRSSGHP